MELLIVRHAIAFERNAKRWPDDAERPLSPLMRASRAATSLGSSRSARRACWSRSPPLPDRGDPHRAGRLAGCRRVPAAAPRGASRRVAGSPQAPAGQVHCAGRPRAGTESTPRDVSDRQRAWPGVRAEEAGRGAASVPWGGARRRRTAAMAGAAEDAARARGVVRWNNRLAAICVSARRSRPHRPPGRAPGAPATRARSRR